MRVFTPRRMAAMVALIWGCDGKAAAPKPKPHPLPRLGLTPPPGSYRDFAQRRKSFNIFHE